MATLEGETKRCLWPPAQSHVLHYISKNSLALLMQIITCRDAFRPTVALQPLTYTTLQVWSTCTEVVFEFILHGISNRPLIMQPSVGLFLSPLRELTCVKSLVRSTHGDALVGLSTQKVTLLFVWGMKTTTKRFEDELECSSACRTCLKHAEASTPRRPKPPTAHTGSEPSQWE